MKTAITLSLGCVLLAASLLLGQSAPAVSSGYGNETNVDGTADPSAGPIAIVDISFPVETQIGRGNVSASGQFAIYVQPALIAGHNLVAVDNQGRRSVAFAVAAPRSTPSSPPGPRN